MSWIDIPPLWLAGALGLVALLRGAAPGLAVEAAWLDLVGGLCVGAGLLLIALALREMIRAKTTAVPRRDPARLVTGGVFGLSRNPIYLGDTLILTGAILAWGVLLALPLAPAFAALIGHRFIRGEEARLRAAFGAEFDAYAARTRRWF